MTATRDAAAYTLPSEMGVSCCAMASTQAREAPVSSASAPNWPTDRSCSNPRTTPVAVFNHRATALRSARRTASACCTLASRSSSACHNLRRRSALTVRAASFSFSLACHAAFAASARSDFVAFRRVASTRHAFSASARRASASARRAFSSASASRIAALRCRLHRRKRERLTSRMMPSAALSSSRSTDVAAPCAEGRWVAAHRRRRKEQLGAEADGSCSNLTHHSIHLSTSATGGLRTACVGGCPSHTAK
jgi:hypothetical protein